MKPHTTSNAAFFLVTAFCMVLMAWWVFFMVREAGRLEELGRLIPADRLAEAAKILGVPADSDIAAEAERRRWMFTSESIVLGMLVMLGVFLLYRGMVRERRMRELQERFLTGATHHLKTPPGSDQPAHRGRAHGFAPGPAPRAGRSCRGHQGCHRLHAGPLPIRRRDRHLREHGTHGGAARP
ncbi:MAG: hypothetical protein ACYST0_00780 [Planctomycetota bacterium]|jgi:hypothetical protein